jgi:beta-1,4-mannosyl-glycoprotein beta-1,4-N-acetylglucosaminyltransferase
VKNKIFDCCIFFNSNYIFKIRFDILKNVVNHFIVCVANTTHIGQKKNNFDIKKWSKFKDKIIYIRVNNTKKINLN